MVWGAIVYDSWSTLIVMRGTLTGQRYVDDILRPYVGPLLNGLSGAIFQQDNARPHTARVAQDFLRHFQTLPWQARSPDLSLVEHELIAVCNLLHLEFTTELESCCDIILTHLCDLTLFKSIVLNSGSESDLELNENLRPKTIIRSQLRLTQQVTIYVPKNMKSLDLNDSAQNLLPLFDKQNTCNSFLFFNLRDLLELVKPFTSRDSYSIKTFISDIEDIFRLYQITNPIHQIIFVKKCLKGPAENLIRSIREITNWSQMKEHLLNEFSDRINSAQLHNMMQARRLKPTETLQEYFLTMRDLAHKGAVDDSSLIDYIIDGIPDSSNNKIILYGSKTLSEFKDKLKIYEKLLNSKHNKQFPDKRFRDYENSTSNQHRIEHKRFTNQQPICYLCGLKGHKSTLCPNKERGKKCYGCKNFGHVQAECPKNSRKITPITNHKINTQVDRTVNSISILSPPKNLMHVEITISKIPITALFDTGIGRDRVDSKGYFKNFITIQNTALPAKIHVVNDETIPLDGIIGIDFLQQTKFTFGRDGIRIFRDVDECKNDDVLVNLANLFDEQQCKLDLPHISNSKIRNDVEQLVNSYKPKKIYDTDLKMTILLSDDIPVSQRSRRLPFVEQKIVENQIQEWLNTNIIKPSCSDYAAPIVLCKRKTENTDFV
ncbi:transposon Tf2-9 polyprotein [Trichonephila clavipes]|nr:transposon Tf2-9 polyprotein [Trichonephila clavipes]